MFNLIKQIEEKAEFMFKEFDVSFKSNEIRFVSMGNYKTINSQHDDLCERVEVKKYSKNPVDISFSVLEEKEQRELLKRFISDLDKFYMEFKAKYNDIKKTEIGQLEQKLAELKK